MKSKRWLSVFFIILFIGIGGYMGVNYYANPLGYFTVKRGLTSFWNSDYTRAIKSEYVTKNADQIDAVVLAGSKGGVLSTELLTEYTGKRYYNFYNNVGNFSDYLKYTKFLIENTNISEITLHLSSFEVSNYSNEQRSSNYKTPAIVEGNLWDRATEFLGYLMSDLKTVLKELKENREKDISKADNLITGERNWKSNYGSIRQDPDAYIKRKVITNLDDYLASFFDQDASENPAFDQNVEALKQIKALCDENNVTLKVVIGASFVGERNTYECYRYYEYLREIVSITDVWDFSDFNDINMNPYNFIDRKHYVNGVADLMVNTMYGGESREGFGIYLTQDNINDYLAKRMADYERLKQEFETTGTIALQGREDDSYIPSP